MNAQIQSQWSSLYQGTVAQNVAFRALEGDPAELLRLLVANFAPGEDGKKMMCADLSDGLRSLFSFSLALGLFHVEQELVDSPAAKGFNEDLVREVPILTLFAVEEPENHLSPHYLGQVVAQLSKLAAHPKAQVLLSSHCPAILSRVRPDDVRYCLGNEHSASTKVKPLPLPTDSSDESFKYVREAIRGHPELYFSRLVIFGEGPSEEIVLRRVFEASGSPLDTNFISIVPLGGRHVNHFWRLVHGLEIPHITLLDLDREKEGAGWSRLNYVRKQLLLRLGEGHARLRYTDVNGVEQSLAGEHLATMETNSDTDTKAMAGWMSFFQSKFNIHFANPLDIDFAMLEAFPATYKGQAVRGPQLPQKESPEYASAISDRMRQVLAANPKSAPATTGSSYTAPQQELFPWYKYLFVDGSKPVAHMRAMIALSDDELLKGLPEFLKELVSAARKLLDVAEKRA